MTRPGGVGRGIALGLVRLAAPLVPRDRRSEWRKEWEAEVESWMASGRSPLPPALGVFRHALSLRMRHGLGVWAAARHALRFSFRSLIRRPLFSTAAVLTLALGMGATTSVYSIVDSVLLAPLPYPGGERFFRVDTTIEDLPDLPLTIELLTEWRRDARTVDAMEGYVTRNAGVVGTGSPVMARQARISTGFLRDLLQVTPVLGRHFRDADGEPGAATVVLLSEPFWRTRFDARPDILGETLRIDGEIHEITGVVSTVALLPDVEVWTPHPPPTRLSDRYLGAVRALLRPVEGVDAARVLDDLTVQAERAGVRYPGGLEGFVPLIRPFRDSLVGEVRTRLLLLLGAVGAVLLIACVNVANLLLARGVERRKEIAVRRSLGASPTQLAVQVGAEGLVLALIGGSLGVAFAIAAAPWILALLPAEIPLASSISVDGRVLVFTALLTLGTTLLVALLPMVRVLRVEGPVAPGDKAGGGRVERRSGRLLLGLEVTQACVLLVAAGLMMNTFVRITIEETGFDPEGLVFAHLLLPNHAYAPNGDGARRVDFFDRVKERVRRLPGVEAVGVGSGSPFSGITFLTGAQIEGGTPADRGAGGVEIVNDDTSDAYFSRIEVDEGYLGALALPVVSGRGFRSEDFREGPVAILINRTAAEAHWPDRDPVGRRLRLPESREEFGEWMTIVGIVDDISHPALPESGVSMFFMPLSPSRSAGTQRPSVLIRHTRAPEAVIAEVRQAIWAVDPELPIPTLASAAEELGAGLASPRFYTALFGIFAGIALLLTSVGIYAVMGHSVARRTREIGIRMALGAPRGQVGSMVVREGMTVVAVGLLIGMVVAAGLSRLMENLLYELSPIDPLTYSAVGVTLFAVAALAAWFPARRAMGSDPVAALRGD